MDSTQHLDDIIDGTRALEANKNKSSQREKYSVMEYKAKDKQDKKCCKQDKQKWFGKKAAQ